MRFRLCRVRQPLSRALAAAVAVATMADVAAVATMAAVAAVVVTPTTKRCTNVTVRSLNQLTSPFLRTCPVHKSAQNVHLTDFWRIAGVVLEDSVRGVD